MAISGESSRDANRFEVLLQELGQEHESEISRLLSEIERLQSPHQEQVEMPVPAQAETKQPEGVETPALETGDSNRTSMVSFELPSSDNLGRSCRSIVSSRTSTASFPRIFKLKTAWMLPPAGADHWEDLDQTLHYYGRTSCRFEGFQKRSKASTSLLTRRAWAISPLHPARMWWDFAGLILISYDMVAIPIFLAFEPEDLIFTQIMGWITLFFWTLDMFASMVTGYYKEGRLIMDIRKILKSYLKCWFWVDCIIVVPDWVMKVMGTMTNIAGLGRALRIARIMRVLRMLRLVKLNRLMGLIYDMIDSEHMFIVVDLVKMLCVILFLNHVVACVWYLIGRLSKEGGAMKNWLEDVGLTPVWDTDLSWKYLTCLHWSITQFTPASMDVSATNVPERTFSVVVLFWALVALSSIIGNVTASVTALRNMSMKVAKEFWLLRKYLKQRNISKTLINRIVKFMEFRCHTSSHLVSPDNVNLLRRITAQLQAELAHEMNAPLLESHLFLGHISVEFPTLTFRMCHLSLYQSSMAKYDVVFQPGIEATSMYFVKLGRLQYRDSTGHPFGTFMESPQWSSEPVLWTYWRHHGYLIADTEADILGILPDKFSEVMRMHPGTWRISKRYGSTYVRCLSSLPRNKLIDVMFDKDISSWAFEKATSEASEKAENENGAAESAEGNIKTENGGDADGVSTEGHKLLQGKSMSL